MKNSDFEELKKPAARRLETILVDDLENRSERTLLWGYTPDRASHHVYLKDGEIHVLVYNGGNNPGGRPLEVLSHRFGKQLDVEEDHVIPLRRLYPEACDIEFCRLLKDRGFNLPFTNWDDQRAVKQFHGVVV